MKRIFGISVIIFLYFLSLSQVISQEKGIDNELWHLSKEPAIYPTPRKVDYSNEYIALISSDGKMRLALIASNETENKAAAVFNRQMQRSGINAFPVYNSLNKVPKDFTVIINFQTNQNLGNNYPQAYSIKFDNQGNSVVIQANSFDRKGCIYSATTLAQLITFHEGTPVIRKADVEDYPDYSRRVFHGLVTAENLAEFLDWMVRYKIEGLVVHNRKYSWWKLDDELKEIFVEFKKWDEKFGGVELMQPHNIYETEDIEISNETDVNALLNNVKIGLEHGVTRLIILADDTPPFKFGEGYILTTEQDKKRFKHMAEAHCYLMNTINSFVDSLGYECELYYVPGFYTYEEMHYGDMELFKDTPWEEDAYGPLYRDLDFIGKNIDEDIEIIWCGTKVRSRTITDNELKDWTKRLNGRVPFLWDNTIYSHYPFTSTSMLTAYNNEFPEDFHLKTSGNGMFINGDMSNELSRSSSMTINDYLWNSKNYAPERSLNEAIAELYGKDLVEDILELRDTELEIRKMIGERELWFEADTLWKVIRSTRFITEKNPFPYHLNYTRLKALRLQLKNSVPAPAPLEGFKDLCLDLLDKRNSLLEKLENEPNKRLSTAFKKEFVKVDLNQFKK